MVPLMLPVAPVATVIVIALMAFRFKAHPVATTRSLPADPVMVKITAAALWRFTTVLFETRSCPIVSVGTAVTDLVVASLNRRISVVAGVVRTGLQFAATFHAALSAPIQV
jgi:hypothetical protein